MTQELNHLNQPIGFALPDWRPCAHPRGSIMQGERCRLEPIDPERHAADLFTAFARDQEARNWTYMPYGPFDTEDGVRQWIEATCLGEDPCFFAIIDLASEKAVGVASYLRIDPAMGVIEVGHIHFSPLIQGTVISTEAMYLMMRRVFGELGYRRYEWKCDALNAPSRGAALRLGFMFEGVFRQATMYKQRNRDTAWYSILDREWAAAHAGFEAWLNADNFDASGRQLQSLGALMHPALKALRDDSPG